MDIPDRRERSLHQLREDIRKIPLPALDWTKHKEICERFLERESETDRLESIPQSPDRLAEILDVFGDEVAEMLRLAEDSPRPSGSAQYLLDAAIKDAITTGDKSKLLSGINRFIWARWREWLADDSFEETDAGVPTVVDRAVSTARITIVQAIRAEVRARPYVLGAIGNIDEYELARYIDGWLGQRESEHLAEVEDDKIRIQGLPDHRNRILNEFARRKGIEDRKTLARHLKVSADALRAMVRDGLRRYSEKSLERVLDEIGVSRSEWDNKPKA